MYQFIVKDGDIDEGMCTCQKKLAFVENSNSNNYHVYMLQQCADLRVFQSMIIAPIIIQVIRRCQHILRPFILLVLKRDGLFLVIYVPTKYPRLEKRSSGHTKNNRIPSKGEEKLPYKCTRCGGHGHNRLKFITLMWLRESDLLFQIYMQCK